MLDLTLVVIGNTDIEIDGIEVLSANNDNIKEVVEKAQGKYITFLSDKDSITDNYLDVIKEKIKEEFDYCFINYDYSMDKNEKVLKNARELSKIKPYYKEYLFSFILDTRKLKEVMMADSEYIVNQYIDRNFVNGTAIEEVIYYHDPTQERRISDFIYTDVKEMKKYKNIIYMGSGCNGIFNGYITWIRQLGKCYTNKFDVTVLYDKIVETTKEDFEKYFKCEELKTGTIYVCDRLLVTYSNYFYPKNIINTDKNYLFIHGNMCDYENIMHYKDDIYTNYVAVSKTAAIKAEGYFPTDNIEYVLNPYKLDEEIPRRMKLTSTFRYAPVKCPERVEKMAKLMDEMNIPYTWEVFTDKRENTNVNGLIFRRRTPYPLPYVKDSDYFVLLSKTESFSYAVVEALSVNTKVVVTPIPVLEEIGVQDGVNGIVIPFDYFEDGKEEQLKKVIQRMYDEIDKEMDYKLSDELLNGYDKIFT